MKPTHGPSRNGALRLQRDSETARSRLTWVAVVVSACFSIPGCGTGLVQVSGEVTLDGAPLAEASVSLTPAEGGRPESAVTDQSGRFRFDSSRIAGLSPGEYNVTVVKVEVSGLPSEPASEGSMPANLDTSRVKEHWVTPRRYARTSTSGLTATVTPGMPPVALNLVSND